MYFDLSAESVSLIIVCIIMVYSVRGSTMLSLRNQMFFFCLITTGCSIVTNLASSAMIGQFVLFPSWLLHLSLMLYFMVTPMMGVAYFYYILSLFHEEKRNLKSLGILCCLPYGLYLLVLLSNPFTAVIFRFDPLKGYLHGPWIGLTYGIYYLYSLGCLVLLLLKHRRLDPSLRKVLFCFGILSVGVVAIQELMPNVILTGTAAASALLVIYLYNQNRRLTLDLLTGTLNRQEFLKAVNQRLRGTVEPFTIIILSVNRFKFINDKFGHDNGDLFLRSFSDYLMEIAKINWIYRYNGDQFVILLDKRNREETGRIVRALEARLSSPWNIGSYRYLISVSIGIVECPQVASDQERVVSGMEYAVAHAKDENNHLCVCTSEMLEELGRKTAIIEILREKLAEDSFDVYFQPVWSVDMERFCWAEALMRLNHSELGAISPAEFIPIAEDTGLIVDITYQVLGKACLFVKKLQEAHAAIEGVSVNLSFIQFMQEDLVEKLLDIILRSGVPCSMIKLEVTEGVLITNAEMVRSFIMQMSSHGIRFGLDDFGTGYSNLSSVLEIPFDTIKLDKSLVWSAMQNPESAGFLRYLTRAFKEMGQMVLAEGVETKEQDAYVRECGCGWIQGYYYARPMPEEEAVRLFLKEEQLFSTGK